MVRILSVIAMAGLVSPATAQMAFHTPTPAMYTGGMPSMFNYAAPLAPSVAIGAYAVAYRAPTMAPMDARYIPTYAYAAYAPGFAYPFIATYGLAYTAGARPYVTAYEGQTMIPAILAYSAPTNYVYSMADDFVAAPRSTYAYRAVDMPRDIVQMTLHVPMDAEVQVNGKNVPSTGMVRTFTTGSLTGPMNCEIKVRRGNAAETVMNVMVKPGDEPAIHVMQ